MAASRWLPVLLMGLVGCTPLGGWLYGDPSFALTEVRVHGDNTATGDTVEFLVMGCNLNDFDLMGTSMAMSLKVDGRTVSETRLEGYYSLAMRDSTRLLQPLTVPISELRKEKGGGRLPYVLAGETVLQTPIGERTVRFQVKGDVSVSGDPPKLVTTGSRISCHPGRSTLPPAWPTPEFTGPPIDAPPRLPPGERPGEPPQ